MTTEEILNSFTQLGGEFLVPSNELITKLNQVKAFVFDWDGVFNSSEKNENRSSNFNEADSMGTNLIRFSHYLHHKQLPVTAVISGEKNSQSFYFTQREYFNACYFKIAHKIDALNHFCTLHQLHPSEVCYFFDDVLDLSIAEKCGFRVLMNRHSGILFKNYIRKNKLADYITAHTGAHFGVRESCELIMGILNTFDEVIKRRTLYDETYSSYILKRNLTPTDFFTFSQGKITKQENSTEL